MKSGVLKRVLKRALVVLVGLVLTVAFVEIGTRLTDPFGISHFMNMRRYMGELCQPRLEFDRLFVHRPNTVMHLYGWDIRTDSRGFRGPELAVPKPQSVKRMLFIGDSVTFGWGVNEDDTFVRMIEEDLATQSQSSTSSDLDSTSGARWETVNGGHLFHDTTQERGVLEEAGLVYQPDIVFLVFVDNDVHPTAQMKKPAEERPVTLTEADIAEVHTRKAVLDQLKMIAGPLPFTHELAKFLFTKYRNYRFVQEAGNEDRNPHMLDRAGIDTDLGWSLSQKAILEMKALAEGSGAQFVVLDAGKKPRLEEFCGEHSLLFVRITHGDAEGVDVRNSRSDPHANRKGHRQYADKIMRAIADLKLVP